MTPEEMRDVGKRIRDAIEREARLAGLDNDGVLTLLLTCCFSWAGLAGIDPTRDPRPLFERAVRIWDALKRGQRIQVVNEIPHNGRTRL